MEGTTPTSGMPRYRIERASAGYCVHGPGIVIWEETLGEAQERREELEGGRRHASPEPASPLRSASIPHESVYGPVASRRLGRSLGIDPTPPGCRVCSFDCVYCTAGHLPRPGTFTRWPEPDEIARSLRAALRRHRALDSVTFSGHGEPTLHPRFPALVDAALDAVAQSGVDVPVRILTNGTQTVKAPVRSALDRLAERIVKLDADAPLVDRPSAGCSLADRMAALARLRDVALQSCFIDGEVSNIGRDSVRVWADRVGEIRPRSVQIYTIDEQPAAAGIRPAGAIRLEEIACELRARTGIDARVYA